MVNSARPAAAPAPPANAAEMIARTIPERFGRKGMGLRTVVSPPPRTLVFLSALILVRRLYWTRASFPKRASRARPGGDDKPEGHNVTDRLQFTLWQSSHHGRVRPPPTRNPRICRP